MNGYLLKWMRVEVDAVIDGVPTKEVVSYLLGKTDMAWSTAWFIFAGFALVVAVSFMFLFKYKHVREEKK